MATIKLSSTKVANRLISYAEKRATEREGVDCPAEYAKAQMTATRELWGKNDGIQAHHVIQSFKPGEVTPELANQIGQELASEIAKGHECAVYTHTDKDHIHNHIVINSVSYEDGRKFHAHGKEAIERVREASDRLCLEKDLSVVYEKSANIRYTLTEQALIDKGKDSWKMEIRDAIDIERQSSKNYEDFKRNLTKNYGITVKERGKNITFTHPENGKKVRGNKLGNLYEKEMLKRGFQREIAREEETGEHHQERGIANLSNSAGSEIERTRNAHEGNQRPQRSDEGLYSSSHGQRWDKPNDDRPRAIENQKDQSGRSGQNDFDFEKARRHAERLRQSTSQSYGEWQERDVRQQSADASKDERNRGNVEQQHERNDHQNERKHERTREQSNESYLER